MDRVAVGPVEIAYETHGDPADPAVLLIAGLGGQLIMWPQPLVHAIAIAGHFVIRFDNRDAGLSTHLGGKLNLSGVAAALRKGERPEVPYLLADMAADAIGLLDGLTIERTHVVGISMGGAIGQEMAIAAPARLRSLTSIMASTGARDVGRPSPRGNRALFHAPPLDRNGAVAAAVRAARLLAGAAGFDADRVRLEAAWAYDRAFDPQGTGRQLGAVWASPDRTAALRSVAVPALVIHGSVDPLVDVTGGRATATAIPGADYVEIDGMGHDLHEAYWPLILRPLLDHLKRSG